MLNFSDIQWARNVKRDGGSSLAYYDHGMEDRFVLNWSKRFKDEKQALKPAVGDIILLFQSHSGLEVQLTHLVTPVNHQYVNCNEENPDYPWGRKVLVLAQAPKGLNPKPFGLDFTSVNQNHSYPIEKIRSSWSKEDLQKTIWQSFSSYFNPNFDKLLNDLVITTASQTFEHLEGKEQKVIKAHIFRERSSALVKEKKRTSKPICECCGFKFSEVYGPLGEGYIECHHKVPIHKGERITLLEDLALVCANCHRMLHRKYGDQYLSVEGLSLLIKSNKHQNIRHRV